MYNSQQAGTNPLTQVAIALEDNQQLTQSPLADKASVKGVQVRGRGLLTCHKDNGRAAMRRRPRPGTTGIKDQVQHGIPIDR